MASSVVDENWSRCAIGMKLHGYAAVIEILDLCGLPTKDPKKLHECLKEFKRVKGNSLGRVFNEDQWEKLCHDCQLKGCSNACANKGNK